MIDDEIKRNRARLIANKGGGKDCGEWLHVWYKDHNKFNPEYGKISEVCEKAAFAFFGIPWVRKPPNEEGHDFGRDVEVPGLGKVQIKGIDQSWDLLVPSGPYNTSAAFYILVKYWRDKLAELKGWAYRSEVIAKRPVFWPKRLNHIVPKGELHPMNELLELQRSLLETPVKQCIEQLLLFNMEDL